MGHCRRTVVRSRKLRRCTLNPYDYNCTGRRLAKTGPHFVTPGNDPSPISGLLPTLREHPIMADDHKPDASLPARITRACDGCRARWDGLAKMTPCGHYLCMHCSDNLQGGCPAPDCGYVCDSNGII